MSMNPMVVNLELVGKIIKLVDVESFQVIANEGGEFPADVLAEFEALKVIRVDGEDSFAAVAVSRLHEAKYDIEEDQYDIEWNMFAYELRCFEEVK